MNRPSMRILKLYFCLLALHLWNAWRQNPLSWVVNIWNITKAVLWMTHLETPNAVDNAIAAEVDRLKLWHSQKTVSVPRPLIRCFVSLHPYPEAL